MNRQIHPSNGFPVRVLIVDDHPTTATTLARAVSKLGGKVEVLSATSGREALERVEDKAADILITDMIMPDMNGLELAERLQNHPGGRPFHIILITAYDVPGLKESSRRTKVDEIIVKPARPERICQIVERLVEEWERSQSAAAAKEQAASRPFKILIADDRPDNVALLSRYVENEGYAYVTAADGEEALAQAREHTPDLLLLDVNMPKKDGFAVLEEIRADPILQHTPVIILTAARLDPADIQSGLNLGADDYVTKPFDRRELMARVRTKLRVKEAGDDLLRRNRELSLLLEITGILNARGPLDAMLNDALQLLVRRLGASAGYILNFENDMNCSFPAASAKIDPLRLKEYLGSPHRANGARLIADLREEASWKIELDETARSAVAVAMSDRRGGMLGAMLLTHGESAYFKAEQVPILQAIANQTAVAIENAQWYASLQGGRAQRDAS